MKTTNSLIVVLSCVLLACNVVAFAEASTEQKAVLVTGASFGIELRIAETLAENGFYGYAGTRKEVDLERLDAAVDFIRGEGRGLWGIVNNAGVVALSP